jgi:hypothetical protein
MKIKLLLSAFLIGSIITVNAQKYKANVLENITTPNSVQTKYAGELSFKDGLQIQKKVGLFIFVSMDQQNVILTKAIRYRM